MDFYASDFESLASKSQKSNMAVLTGPIRSCIGWANVKTAKFSRPNRRYVSLGSAKLTICANESPRSQVLSVPITSATLVSTSTRNECLFRNSAHQIWIQWPSESQLKACKAAFEFSKRVVDDYYKLVTHRQLGKGRSSEVVFAFDTSNGDHAAVKVMNKDKARSTDREFAEKEVLIRMTVQHPCIVQTLDIFESQFDLFLVMELMPGGSLDRKITKMGYPLDETEARIIMRRIFAALQHLHERNIVHRNVKPQNIFLDLGDDLHWPYSAKLSNFGLACILDDPNCKKQIVGTPEYLAPEASFMTPTGEGSREVVFGVEMDMWACGVMLYNLLSMQLPFEGDTPAEVFKRSRRGKVRFGPAFAKVSYEAMSLIRALLNVDRRKRLTAETVLLHPWFLLPMTFGANYSSSDENEENEPKEHYEESCDDTSAFDVEELSDGIRRFRIAATAVLMLVRLRTHTPGIAKHSGKVFQFNVAGVDITPGGSAGWGSFSTCTNNRVSSDAEKRSDDNMLKYDGGRCVLDTAMSRVSTGSTVKSRSSAGTDSAGGARSDGTSTVAQGVVTQTYEQENEWCEADSIERTIAGIHLADDEGGVDRSTRRGRWKAWER